MAKADGMFYIYLAGLKPTSIDVDILMYNCCLAAILFTFYFLLFTFYFLLFTFIHKKNLLQNERGYIYINI
ncbi:hypothetical protein BBH99_06770 [Chryseobacterium contaminans]|uniref:Uncharacterized protein n=1 Tax=Chryseobacterium contaminans TaxID=1423959 RepID=A0ABX2XBQ0_9FLAO|nr:hypothetical protein BBH99_06770 [Chryseobacterium contaminans]